MTDCFTEGSGQVIVRMIDRWQDHSDGLFLFTWSFISDWLSPKQFPVPCFCRLAGRFHVMLTGCHTCTLIQCYPHTWTGTHIHTCVIDWTGTILRVLLLGYFFFFLRWVDQLVKLICLFHACQNEIMVISWHCVRFLFPSLCWPYLAFGYHQENKCSGIFIFFSSSVHWNLQCVFMVLQEGMYRLSVTETRLLKYIQTY